MVPRVTSKGRSFKGAGAYFLHDLGKAETTERVAFTHTVNMVTDDPDKALKVMAWTAAHAAELKELSGQKTSGRKADNPVYNFMLAWAPDQNPGRDEMIAFGARALEALGVGEHEALMIGHADTDHKHLHIILNRVHPVTGKTATMAHDRNLLSRLAQAYEEETGRVYCAERVANNNRRDLGEKHVKAAPEERQTNTPEYQAKRQARIDAQRAAGELAAKRAAEKDAGAAVDAAAQTAPEAAESRSPDKARDLKADFDNASARDDRQYRAREIERPKADEDREAQVAWKDEQTRERARQQAEERQAQEARRFAAREKVRREWIDVRRAAEWEAYQAKECEKLDAKQAERRTALADRHAEARASNEGFQEKRFGPQERQLRQQIAALTRDLERKGLRGLIDQVTGHRAETREELDALKAGLDRIASQKQRAREMVEARQQQQREAQERRQEAERDRKSAQLDRIKEKQDERFEAKEQERAARMAEERAERERARQEAERARETERAAKRQVAREEVAAKEREREERAQYADLDLGRTFGRDQGMGLGR